MCITHPAHPSLQQRFAPATPAAAQDTRRGARKVTRTCRSAWQVRRLRVALVASRRAAFKHVRGTASTATWMTWQAGLALQWDDRTCTRAHVHSNVTLLLKLSLS